MDRELPPWVRKVCSIADAWIVGSGADPSVSNEDLNDYDVMVSFENWEVVSRMIPSDARPNTFGGWKFYTELKDGKKVEVDVWPDDMAKYLYSVHFRGAYHPQTKTLVKAFKCRKGKALPSGGVKTQKDSSASDFEELFPL